MNGVIQEEALFFLVSVSTGALILFGYDLLRALREVFPERKGLLSAGDFLYWCMAGIGAFCVVFQRNSGALRGFCVAGMALGMLLYYKSVSRWILGLFTGVFRAVSTVFGKIFHVLRIPAHFFLKKPGKNLRKRLKNKVKEIRMYLNKH